jgi:hypothetical protein
VYRAIVALQIRRTWAHLNARAVALIDVRTTVAGEPYANEVAQTIDLRWAKIVKIVTLEDIQKLEGALARLAEAGVAEAAAEAIGDRITA